MNKKRFKLMYMAIAAVITMLLTVSISVSAEKPAHWPKTITIAGHYKDVILYCVGTIKRFSTH